MTICFNIIGILLLTISQLFLFNFYFDKKIELKNKQTKEPEVIEIKKEEKKIYNKLMIVAHPDDDTIFGGEHLVDDDYVVVCVTCGVNPTRLQEFKTVMNYSDDKYIYLKHTDLYRGFISRWSGEKDDVKDDLEQIINSQNWEMIVTHNPDGEYGHIQHILINEIVTKEVEDKSKLYYFGKYYTNDYIKEEDNNNETFNKKKPMLEMYKSQRLNEKSRYNYMFRHEDWIKYEEWEA